MTVTAHLEVRIKPDNVEEAYAILHESLADTRAFAGNIGIDVRIDRDDPAHLLIIETWESEEADTAYRTWRRSGNQPSAATDLFAGPPTLTFWTNSEI